MNIYKRVHGQSAQDKLRELIDLHGYELFLARVLLLEVDETICEKILNNMEDGSLI